MQCLETLFPQVFHEWNKGKFVTERKSQVCKFFNYFGSPSKEKTLGQNAETAKGKTAYVLEVFVLENVNPFMTDHSFIFLMHNCTCRSIPFIFFPL